MKLYLSETLRKSIHLGSLVIPLSYRYVVRFDNRHLAFSLLLIAFAVSMVVEFYRFWQRDFRRTFNRVFGTILRRHEMKDFTGATFLLFSSMLCVAFFIPPIASCAIAMLSIGDTFAALVGLNFGKRRFGKLGKSLEGSLACFVSCLIFGILWLQNPILAFTGAISATLAELMDIPLDDNLRIPLISGLAMTIMQIII